MSERQPQDHAARLRALDPQASFLVQAPAGSGKTELLTDRILALLATVSRPEEIVAITFTRKAASEMHARVLEKLARALGPEPEAGHEQRSWQLGRKALERDAEQGWFLLQHPARLAIRTIDSFCAGLVRGMPWLSGLGGMPDIADDARVHYEAAARATLALADEHPSIVSLLAHLDVDVLAAEQAIADMLGQRDQWLPLLAHGMDRDGLEEALADTLAAELESLRRAMPRGCDAALCGAARLAAAELSAGDDARLEPLLDWVDPLEPDAYDLPRWRALAHLLLTGTGSLRSPKGVTKALGFPAKCAHKEEFVQWLSGFNGSEAWISRLDGVRSMPDAQFTEAQWDVLSSQLVTLALAVGQLHKAFAQAGEVDFIEISQRAQRALGDADDPGELLLKLDASIRHLLVDEFQDTSLTQIELLTTLTAGWQAGDGRTLFLVGDPMQSIYRFRKAEVGLFLRAAQRGIGELDLEYLQLTDNFRSQGGVVDWVNRSFAQLLPAQNDAVAGAISYSPSAAFHPALDGDAVRFHAAWAGDGLASGDAAAEDIAVQLVREALAAHKGSAHPAAILVRARTHLGSLSRRLAQEGIPSRAVELVPLRLRPVVADLVQLLRALLHAGDRMAWLSVLRAPWCGLTLDSLQKLFGNDHRTPIPDLLRQSLAAPPAAQGSLFDAPEPGAATQIGAARRLLDAAELARLSRVAAILLDRGNDSGAWPLAAWLQDVWQRLGGAGLYAGVGAATDAESLFQLVERLAPHGGLDLGVLDTAVARLFAAPDVEGEEGAVEIMTMHKSKGLQFDTVILYGLHRIPRGDQAPLVRFEQHEGRVLMGPIKARADTEADPISRYLGAREARRASYETDRLLYVAATRARKRLHLIGNVVMDAEKGGLRAPAASSLLGRLWPHVQAGEPPLDQQAANTHPGAVPAYQGEALKRLDDASVATLAARPGRSVAPGGIAADAEHPAWQLEAGYEAAVGTLAHAWLARMGEEGADAWSAERLSSHRGAMRRQLTRAGIPDSQADAAADAVLHTLQATLEDEPGRWLLSQSRARREWPLIDASGRISVIDLALSTDQGWLIVDYKTGQPQAGEPPASFAQRMRLRHAEQLQRYCAQVTALDGRPAKAALYFPRAKTWIDLAG